MTVRERPILFSGPMVRAILDGRKTQTRRVAKGEPFLSASGAVLDMDPKRGTIEELRCPYGQPGDLLWVRETYYPAFRREGNSNGCVYRADDNGRDLNPGWSPNGKGGGWKPSIFMPRWASRLTLRITEVRVQRLQDISEADADDEGGIFVDFGKDRWGNQRPGWRHDHAPATHEESLYSARFSFANLWDSINGKGSWDANPWVWVITFERAAGEQP